MNKNNKEKHLSLEEDQHEEFRLLAKKEGRTMRGMFSVMMKKYKGKKDD